MNSPSGTLNGTDIKNAGTSAIFYAIASAVGLTLFYTILSLQTSITPLLLAAGVSSTVITVVFNVGRQLYNAFYAGDTLNQIENVIIGIVEQAAAKYFIPQAPVVTPTPTITSPVITPINATPDVSIPTI